MGEQQIILNEPQQQSLYSSEPQPTQARGIERISVQGFKALRDEISLEIRPLTILAGANSSGKSSILQPLLLMKQTLEAPYDPGPLKLDGPDVRFTSGSQLFCSLLDAKESLAKFTVGIYLHNVGAIVCTFERPGRKGVRLTQIHHQFREKEFTVKPVMTATAVKKIFGDFGIPLMPTLARSQNSDKITYKPKVSRERCFFALELTNYSKQHGPMGGSSFNPSGQFGEAIRNVIHIPGLRGNPERSYRLAALTHETRVEFLADNGNHQIKRKDVEVIVFPGIFESYVAGIVQYWQSVNDPRFERLCQTLEAFGLTYAVEAKVLNDVEVELRVGRTPKPPVNGRKDMVSIADVGFGVSQVLPVVVALLAAEPGQMVYIEQPELHLHPRAQEAMATLLANVANNKVQVVIETHSSTLLLAIRTLVVEGKLDPKLVKLHWFSRDAAGVTSVESDDIDRAGGFGGWPEDFTDVEFELSNRYFNAADAFIPDQEQDRIPSANGHRDEMAHGDQSAVEEATIA